MQDRNERRCINVILLLFGHIFSMFFQFRPIGARRGGTEVAGSTLDRKIRVRLPAYPHRVWALWWQGGLRRLRTSRCPCRGSLGTLKTPSCPWRWVPGSRSKFGNWTTLPSLYSWNIAECDVKPQPTIHFRPIGEMHFCTCLSENISKIYFKLIENILPNICIHIKQGICSAK